MRYVIISGALALFLSACGGGGGTSSASAISGRVADGYIKGATVFWDCNGDYVLNADEIQTASSTGGGFTIQSAPFNSCQLAAHIPVGAIDEDHPNQPIDRSYTLLAVKGSEKFISPLSTIVSQYISENPSSSADDASKIVADFLGVRGNILNDYIEETGADAIRRHGVAQVLTVVLQNNKMNGATEVSLSNALSDTKSLATSISSANLSTSENIEAFANPLRAFLKPLEPTKYSKSIQDVYKVRPNSKISLTETQKVALNSIIALPAIQRVTRWGVINWSELTATEFDEAYSLLQGNNILAEENDAVKAIRAQRTKFLNETSEYYSQKIASKATLFSHDFGTNLQYFSSAILLPSLDAIGGLISVQTGLPTVSLKRYRGQSLVKGIIKSTTRPPIKDVIKSILVAVNISTESRAKIKSALEKGDTEAFSDEEFNAFAELTGQLIEIQKEIFKKKNLGVYGELFGPALNIYGISRDCSLNASLTEQNPECFSAYLEISESIAEWGQAPLRFRAGLQVLRAIFDAYASGKEYANATDYQIIDARDQVITDWNSRVNGMMLVFKKLEFDFGGYDQYFEAFDPTAPCPTGTTSNAYGECVKDNPVASWCNQTITFDNNTLPLNWTKTLIRSGPGLQNNRMEASPLDSGIYITASEGSINSAVTSIIVEFDNFRTFSYYGQFNQVAFKTSTNKFWIFSDGNFSYRSGSREFMAYRSNQPPYTDGGVAEFNQVVSDGSIGFGQFHTKLTLKNGLAQWLLTDATGEVKSIDIVLASDFKVSDLVAPTLSIYTTTDGGGWIDNFSLQCVK